MTALAAADVPAVLRRLRRSAGHRPTPRRERHRRHRLRRPRRRRGQPAATLGRHADSTTTIATARRLTGTLARVTRRIALLVNPTSGKGRGGRLLEPVADRLRGSGVDVDVVAGRDADEAFDRVRDRVAAGVDGVVAVGGDGLVNIALQVVAGTDVPLGVVPAGTGNDIARALGLAAGRPGRRRATWWCAAPTRAGRPGPRQRPVVRGRAGLRLRLDGQRAGQPDVLAQRPQPLQPGDPRRAAHLPAGALRARPGRRAVDDRGDAGRGRQRAVVRRRDAGLPGRPARRRAARRHGARARSRSRSSCGCSRRSTRAPTSGTRR